MAGDPDAMHVNGSDLNAYMSSKRPRPISWFQKSECYGLVDSHVLTQLLQSVCRIGDQSQALGDKA